MAYQRNNKFSRFHLSTTQMHLVVLLLLCLISPCIHALFFNFSASEFNQSYMELQEDATFDGSSISLNHPLRDSVGRALYTKPMLVWELDGSTKKLADFTSHFSFQMSNVSEFEGNGHGLAFVLVNENSTLSPMSIGGLLGMFANEESGISDNNKNQIVAVEFDTFKNEWDETTFHMGIDVNSLRSKNITNVTEGFIDRGIANVLVVYNSTTTKLSASLSFPGDSSSYDISYVVDLTIALPQRVRLGFTGATRQFVELHQIYSWSFYSSLEEKSIPLVPPPQAPKRNKPVALVVGLVGGLFVAILVSGVALYCWFRLQPTRVVEPPLVPQDDQHVTRQFPHLDYSGPKHFSYTELANATNGFDSELKLGEGGFGDVYQGKLANSDEEIAVKKFKNGSNQGEKEYVSEVNVISRLMHKNLVQLKGWCHENKELLLVYEFMPNRSLDFHLFGQNFPLLAWPKRYKITMDLASALNYLQDGCDPFVLHRDIKSSNIMLDSKLNAKLGDFGLARLTYQDQSFKTTVPAGTLGYVAPEVISNQRVGKASDTYSFGVVALEIACGRRPVFQSRDDPSNMMSLVKWVWDLYGRGAILDAVDSRLNGEFNREEARRLITVALWCCHPDPEYRPSIRQVQAVLNFEAIEPSLPPSIPKATYVSSTTSMDMTEAGNSTRVSHPSSNIFS